MKKKLIYILIALILILAGCETTEKAVEQTIPEEPKIVEEQVQQFEEPETESEESIYEEPSVEQEEEIEEEPEVTEETEDFEEDIDDDLIEEPVVEEESDEDEEYNRSINNMEGTVTKEDFVEDKKDILARIKKLDDVMVDGDFLTWKTLVEQSSLSYWSLKGNLKKVSSMLPIKGIQLNSLEDYFKFVFIQSRIGRQIDEIRYISDSYVKAVQVSDSQDVVYYYFVKINGVWKLSLPPLSD